MPEGVYEPEPPVHGAPHALVVDFRGEDGRGRSFDLKRLPLPGWHEALAIAWGARIGPSGTLRTLTSAQMAWANLCRLIRFLDIALLPPGDPSRLTAAHLDAFRRYRESTVGHVVAARELRELGLLFRAQPLCDLVLAGALDCTRQSSHGTLRPRPGYSEGEFQRIVAAARADVAQIRDRLQGSEALLERQERERPPLTGDDLRRWQVLADLARGGVATVPSTGAAETLVRRRRLAEQLFVTRRDLPPLLVLLVAVSGYNVEAIKELPVEHRILEGRAVEIVVTKRRRGPQHWHNTVTWEIGPPGRELHTPGGLYLLFHRLMSRSRTFLTTPPAFWAVWHNAHHPTKIVPGHYNPFNDQLNRGIYGSQWAAGHGLKVDRLADPEAVRAGDPGSEDEASPLLLDFNRLKTSVDVRRTRQSGGHLPSAARTNTMEVLFRNYLSGDPTTIDWAQQVVSEAFTDVVEAAWAAHRRTLESSGGEALQIVPGEVSPERLTDVGFDPTTARRAANGDLDTAWSACVDHDRHPVTGDVCRLSFLDCFHCGNCLITRDHLPRLLSLLDALAGRREVMSEDDWWDRYGATWAAIRFDVLTKFSPAEIAKAIAYKPSDALLDLVEPTWEHP